MTALIEPGANNRVIFGQNIFGERPNFPLNQIIGPMRWNTDGAISKSVRLTEGKSMQIRIDASNIFNHVEATAPTMTISSITNFGRLASKSGNRSVQARIRIDF